jgi:23S rRNA pseudouridine2605 synthase
MSRREAENAILAGLVSIDGRIVKGGCKVADSSSVIVNGTHVIDPPPSEPRLWGMIKPRGVISEYHRTASNQKFQQESDRMDKRLFLSDLVNTWYKKDVRDFGTKSIELENINPLFSNLNHFIVINSIPTSATGIVLLTTDAFFASKLRKIDSKILTTFRIRTGNVSDTVIDEMRKWKKGVKVAGLDYGPVFVDVEKRTSTQTWMKVRLVSTNDRQRALKDLFWFMAGVHVNRINVYAFGPYIVTDLPERSVVPLSIDGAISHLVPKREIAPTLIRQQF